MHKSALIPVLEDIVFDYAIDTDFAIMHSNIMKYWPRFRKNKSSIDWAKVSNSPLSELFIRQFKEEVRWDHISRK